MDPRHAPITEAQLRKTIQTLPLTSSEHSVLQGRANFNKLSQAAYDEYIKLAKKNAANPYAFLWRGLMAYSLYKTNNRPGSKYAFNHPIHKRTLDEAAYNLAKASDLLPKSGLAQVYYGYYLWQEKQIKPEGLRIMLKGLKAEPNSALVHAMMAEVYWNPFTSDYDIKKAISELNDAARVDPLYSFPHNRLVRIYLDLKQPAKAQAELNKYIRLQPDDKKDTKFIREQRQKIAEALRREKK